MGTLFMIIAVILLFLGLPASIILTIIAFIKKNISSIFKFSIPIVIGGIVFFLVLGAILLPDTEVKNQELVKTEQQETNNKEKDKKPKEETKVEKEESSTKKEQEKPKEEKPKENNNKKEETKTETKKPNKTKTETKDNKKKEQKPKELTEKEYKKACKEYNYKDVLRNPEKYIGKKIVITVQIQTVKEKIFLNPTKYYFAYSEGDYGLFYEDYYAIFDKRKDTENPKLLSEDIIKVWGEISEPQETTSLILNSEEVFCIDMKYVKLIEE